MSDNPTQPTPPADPKPQPPAQGADKGQPTPQDPTDWKAEARKWESRAKENSEAAKRLAEIEDANKTEAQKNAERLSAAEKRAAEAEARVLRRDVALEHKLSKEDAALLDNLTDENAMKALAVRLAGESGRRKNHVPREGDNPNPTPNRSSWANVLDELDAAQE